MIDENTNKVFGIGLSKTGTSSLADALKLMGITTIHYPYDKQTFHELKNKIFRLKILNKYDAITDITVAPFYQDLDHYYPNSKFILTIRDREKWLDSIKTHSKILNNWINKNDQFMEFTKYISKLIYGTYEFNESAYRQAYNIHLENVLSYFKYKPDQLLILDITSGEGWDKLENFLNIKTPNQPFPRSNSKQDMHNWFTKCNLTAKDLNEILPQNCRYILIDDNQIGDLFSPVNRCRAIPFLEKNGIYWGRPNDEQQAIDEIKKQKSYGAEYVLVMWPAFWMLHYYKKFWQYLNDNHESILINERFYLFRLI